MWRTRLCRVAAHPGAAKGSDAHPAQARPAPPTDPRGSADGKAIGMNWDFVLGSLEDFAFPSRTDHATHISTRQYARLVDEWVTGIGLPSEDYGTHSLRRTKASIIYKATGNLRAVQILLGHTKIESTVRYLGGCGGRFDVGRRHRNLRLPGSLPLRGARTYTAAATRPLSDVQALRNDA